ncbi:hypothetical protein LC55x_3141 [Lysobacter capsici]|nr:hypothetical protein LC55x_3141 [Lysobacter capsici]
MRRYEPAQWRARAGWRRTPPCLPFCCAGLGLRSNGFAL